MTVEPEAPAEDPGEPLGPVNLLVNGSFETPRVEGRVPASKGATPAKLRHEWLAFKDAPADEPDGKVTAGITNEIAHRGKQSLFIAFDRLKNSRKEVALTGNTLGIIGGKTYRISLWGRISRREPLTIDQRLAYLRTQVDFFLGDRELQTGESIVQMQPIPGSRNRPPLFTSAKWTEYYTEVEAPAEAKFIKVTFTWLTQTEKEYDQTSGIAFFDSATIFGEMGSEETTEAIPLPEDPADPAMTSEGEPEAAAPAETEEPTEEAAKAAVPAATPAAKAAPTKARKN